MNFKEYSILNTLKNFPFENQRVLSEQSGHSLGMVNKSLKNLIENGYLTEDICLTEKSQNLIHENSPKNAVILAAGFGMRMIPINSECPKAFLKINGEPLIERIIKQLHQAGITEIFIIVGYMKESFEYLIDEFNVKLIVNSKYAARNNLYSLALAADKLSNTYIIPSDVWCEKNPFNKTELYSWYMVSDIVDDDSTVRVTRKGELSLIPENSGGNQMIGISYLCGNESETVKKHIAKMSKEPKFDNAFWEITLYDKDKMIVSARTVNSQSVIEINSFEQLRELDEQSDVLKNDKIEIAAKVLNVDFNDIKDIEPLKKGMTNRSFLFTCKGTRYIMRIPGEGTNMLINRREEAEVCGVIKDKGLCEEILFIDPKSGYKITKFIDGAKTCDPFDKNETAKCMKKLREFHESGFKVEHTFDIFSHINYYENLWNGNKSAYRDYAQTKENVFKLKKIIDRCKSEFVLTHIDAVPDNFLFANDKDGYEHIYLIDWEYAAMQDPHIDIAMFCIYSMYDRENVDRLIDEYFPEGCEKAVRLKIYCYIAACGLLWSNWCEYKSLLGVEFGEYSLAQYRYAKEYYKTVSEEFSELKEG